MPKFFYTVAVLTVFVWAGALFLGSELSPDTILSILVFLFSLLVAVGLTLSLLVFAIFHFRASLFMNRYMLFRKSLKRGFFLSFVLIGTLALRAFELFTPINYGLFLALCVLIYKQFKSSRM